MALVVEDGTGKSNANSYQSVAGADAYLAIHAPAADGARWSAAAAAVKENALIRGTQYLELTKRGSWRGCKASSTQALAWPRAGAVDDDGFVVDHDHVPQELQDACTELALRLVLGDNLLEVQTTPGEIASESIRVGPVEEQKTYVGGRPAAGYEYPKVEFLVRGLILSGGRVYRA